MTTRRQFLKVMFAAGVAAAIPIKLTKAIEKQFPMIWGDGIHDDTPGLQAAICGEEFIAADDCVTVFNGTVHLASRSFLIKKTLTLTSSGTSLCGPAKIEAHADFDGPMLSIPNSIGHCHLENLHFVPNASSVCIHVPQFSEDLKAAPDSLADMAGAPSVGR